MKEAITASIKYSLRELFDLEGIDFVVEDTKEFVHGDMASNVALIVGKKLDKNTKIVAEEISDFLKNKNIENIESISVAGPGFINFKFSNQFFINEFSKISELGDKWGSNRLFKNKKILVEHSSPNLFKPFHIGHLMNNTVGESITRLAKFSGADVTTISFPSDISLGIGKAIWALLADGEEQLEVLHTIEEKLVYLGDCYVRGTRAYEEDEKVQKEVRDITKKLYEKTTGVENSAYEIGKKINLDYFLDITKRLGSQFDGFVFESEAGVVGKEIVLKNVPNVFKESEGAIVYIPNETRKDINTAVFINSEGHPTYEGKDVGLIDIKFTKYNPDVSLFVTDNQQKPHFDVVLDAVAHISKDWADKSVHITHGRMSFKGQKMSSRLGGVPLVFDILTVVTEDVLIKNSNISNPEAEIIALSALKFSILKAQVGKNINFDPESSLSFEGDSGPYLQYSAVRAKSILEKAKSLGLDPKLSSSEKEITDLEKLICRFPSIIERATLEWAPHHVVGYLLELAQAFNSWYGNTKIIDENNPSTPHNLAITSSVYQTLKNGLWLLGINTPSKM